MDSKSQQRFSHVCAELIARFMVLLSLKGTCDIFDLIQFLIVFPECWSRSHQCCFVWSLHWWGGPQRQVSASTPVWPYAVYVCDKDSVWNISVHRCCGTEYICLLQVWRLCERESGGGDTGLALSLGHCYWFILFNLRCRLAVTDGRSPAPAGHLQGQHHPLSAGRARNSHFLIQRQEMLETMATSGNFISK